MATQAQIEANRKNAARSTGPKTQEGKDASRANALKHGLSASKVLPEREAEEVARRTASFQEELKPSGPVGVALVIRAATLSVRMERCVDHENAALAERVRRAEAEFVPPERCDAAEAARLRHEAGRRALFDDSKEAALARKYESAAERGFFRALKELRQIEGAARAARDAEVDGVMAGLVGGGSGLFPPADDGDLSGEEFDAMCREAGLLKPPPVEFPLANDRFGTAKRVADVPLTVGRRR